MSFLFSFLAPHLRLISYLTIIAASFGSGYQVSSWQSNADMAQLQKEHEEDRAGQAVAALEDMTQSVREIKAAATQYAETGAALNTKIDAVRKDLKNVQTQTKLPVGCAPDLGRVRNLEAAIDAANTSTP